MKILVTGAAGFIGSHTCDALLSRQHEVVGIDNLSMGNIGNLEDALKNPRFKFTKGDIRDRKILTETVDECNTIIHLAAYKIPRYGNSLETLETNLFGSLNLLAVAKEKGVRVLAASTSDVYGMNPEVPFHEESLLLLGPSTSRRWSYSTSKLFEEHLIIAYHEKWNLPYVIFRFFSTYGPRQHLSWWGGPQSVFISAAFEGKTYEIHGDGSQTRTFCYISDLVRGIVAATESQELNAEVLNLGGNEEISILELAHLIHSLTNSQEPFKPRFVPYETFPGHYQDVKRRVPDLGKANRLLEYAPKVHLSEGLKLTIQWQREVIMKQKQTS